MMLEKMKKKVEKKKIMVEILMRKMKVVKIKVEILKRKKRWEEIQALEFEQEYALII